MPFELPQLDILSSEKLNRVSDKDSNSNFLYKCKTNTLPRRDIETILSLHKKLTKIYHLIKIQE